MENEIKIKKWMEYDMNIMNKKKLEKKNRVITTVEIHEIDIIPMISWPNFSSLDRYYDILNIIYVKKDNIKYSINLYI